MAVGVLAVFAVAVPSALARTRSPEHVCGQPEGAAACQVRQGAFGGSARLVVWAGGADRKRLLRCGDAVVRGQRGCGQPAGGSRRWPVGNRDRSGQRGRSAASLGGVERRERVRAAQPDPCTRIRHRCWLLVDGGRSFRDLNRLPNQNPDRVEPAIRPSCADRRQPLRCGKPLLPGVLRLWGRPPGVPDRAVSIATVSNGGSTVHFGQPVIGPSPGSMPIGQRREFRARSWR